jgi:hypothetical protein
MLPLAAFPLAAAVTPQSAGITATHIANNAKIFFMTDISFFSLFFQFGLCQ